MKTRVLMRTTLLFFGLSPLWGESPAPASKATPAAYALKTPYHTEQEWIIGSICRNAVELLSFVCDKRAEVIAPNRITVKRIDGDKVTYRVTLRSNKIAIDTTLHFPGSIWSSQAYVPFCKAAMNRLKLSNPRAGRPPNENPMAKLLDFSEASIEAENVRVSQWLTADPGNALAQEQAALILGTLAMKENSGWFWDPRDICNHATAHLAVARSLNRSPDLGIEGQLAECLVGLIADTKKECAEELDRMEKILDAPKELGAWLRAARMRNSRDWRLVASPEGSSGLEQVEYVRALSEAVSVDQAIRWIRENAVPHRQDWIRIVLEFPFSVTAGHNYALPSVKSEIALMQATFPDRFRKDFPVATLNETPEDVLTTDSSGTSSLRVISGGMWAQYFQRHLCHALLETSDFLQDKWGVHDQADRFEILSANAFSQLALFPYLRQAKALRLNRPNNPAAIPASFAQRPEWAPAFVCGITPGDDPFLASFQKTAVAWFSPPIPDGTAYGAPSRSQYLGTDLKNRPEAIQRLYQIAPLQFGIVELELIRRYSKNPTYAQVQEIMGPFLDYYLPAVRWAAKASDIAFDDRVALQKKAAALDPKWYENLAWNFVKHDRQSEAADAFQRWFDKGEDRVAVSNSMEWLVNYYYDHGQSDKAMVIAKDAAETYSNTGLTTMLNLLVRMEKFDDAEEYGRKIQKRYNDSGPLIAFYWMMAAKGNADFKSKLDAAIADVFPSGLKPVTLSSFAGAPKQGMQFSETTAAMASNGLSKDQVVVALDGYQVQNVAQYTTVRSLSQSPDMALIVWDGHAYREIKARRPGRLFGVDMLSYSR